MFQDINSIPSVAPAELDSHAKPHNSFYPYPNEASVNLGHWYWNGSVQKSQESFKELLDIVRRPDFDPEDVQCMHWDKINSQLGTSINNEEGYEWEDYDAGWHKMEVKIQPDARPYKLANVHDNEYFHYEPYHLRWSPHLPHEVNIQGKLYTSPMFMDAHRKLQASPGEAGCDLPRVITALMFWSDATQLMMFGNARLWPMYMYFGNKSKYCHCKPSCHLANHVAYFQKLLDSFKDFTGTYTDGKGIGHECNTHCHRDLFQAQWKVLLDDKFLEAYKHGIVILCCDGVERRFYPRVFTYLADYPEKVLIATIRQLGGCPCSQCLIPTNRLHHLGMNHDRQQRKTLARADTSRSQLVATARSLIYEKNFGVDSAAVESILKPESWVPTSNVFSDTLGPFGLNIFIALVVDLLHKVELGVWCMLLIHLLRILTSLDKDLIHKLDRRYRQVPPSGPATIRQFCLNVSEMSNMAARNFEDLLQCSIPVFDGLFPDAHNHIIIDLLFTLSHWHGLAKLCMHSDLTLDILDQQTTDLGEQFRRFKDEVCPSYHTQELNRETKKKRSKGQGLTMVKLPKVLILKVKKKNKLFNIQTYKFHVLGDYVACIRRFGTTDSYSTEPGELEHRSPKGRYCRTDRNMFVRQLTQIECREACLHRIKQCHQDGVPRTDVHEIANDPKLHHHIGQSERIYDEFGQYLRNHTGDPAMKISSFRPAQFKHNQIYHHNIARFNYTTYNVQRAQDVVNPRTPHCNIMLLQDDDSQGGHYRYAKVIGIHHINVVRAANVYESHRIEFLFVHWYEPVQTHTWSTCTLGRVHFWPLESQDAFSFVDPTNVLRACHIIPAFSQGQHNPDECGISTLAGDKHNWHKYYINSFVDHDTIMRYHYGLGVGHMYSHETNEDSSLAQVTPCLDTQVIMWTENEHLESRENIGESTFRQPPVDDNDDDNEQDDDEDYVGVEDPNFFDQGLDASTDLLVLALDDMFTTCHNFDYKD
ncbi:hypothetical protein BDR05DRAFT_974997 [Suillus weaverae]|nr:hypothetical protein BDR05DRAFT_974997 [Suillus weaverae]